jgi:CarboxypepD_reg-like domain
MTKYTGHIIICFLLLTSIFSKGQNNAINLSGIVLDSASLQPLAYVAVQVKGKGVGQSTGDTGSFDIVCSAKDTLVFTRLGYKPILLVVKKKDNNLRIILAEDSRMLNDVTVYGDLKLQGEDEWKKDVPPNTQIKIKEQPLEPDANSVATFGPGIVIGFGGKDKNKVKRDENSKTEVYRQTISSEEVKKQLMQLYGISEATYLKKLERFNRENPDAAYLTDPKEIVTMLTQFFALKDPGK